MTEQEVRQWIINARTDGWSMRPTYVNEPVDKAATLEKDGYKAMTLARTDWEPSVSVWGPDGLHIDTPVPYDWDALVLGTRACGYCGKVGDTVRIGFAGRCCPECREEHKARVEYSGWCD